MFTTKTTNVVATTTPAPAASATNTKKSKYITAPDNGEQYNSETKFSMLEELLERETQQNKAEAWNKLDKPLKTQKLQAFAEKYGRENGISAKEIKALRAFFADALDRGKLQRTKDVVYNKETQEIQSIPALHFNAETNHFTLKNMDTKRVATLKSLTPKRISEKNRSGEEITLLP